MREKIIQALDEIEKQHGVHILYAIESGSRMWDFASQNSDYDIRFLYASRPDYYISVSRKRDCIEYTDKENDLDFSGWDLQKALGLLYKSNMSLYEWLRSPIIYRDSQQIHKFRALADNFWDTKSLIYSYIHLARHNYKAYIYGREKVKLKKYLYILRTIAASIYTMEKSSVPPITMPELLLTIEKADKRVHSFLNGIIEAKKAGEEMSAGNPDGYVNAWIERIIQECSDFAEQLPDIPRDITALDRHLYETIKEMYFQDEIKDSLT